MPLLIQLLKQLLIRYWKQILSKEDEESLVK